MITVSGTLSKAWLNQAIGVAFDRDYYFDPDRRHAIDCLCNEYTARTFPDIPVFYSESNLGRKDHWAPNQVLIGGIQPNMILGMLLGADFVPADDRDADITPGCLRGKAPADLPAPEVLRNHDLVKLFDDQIAQVRRSSQGRLRPIPPFFWDASGRAAIHGVLTTAQKLCGEIIFMDMLAEPGKCMELMRWIADAYVMFCRHFAQAGGLTISDVHVGECSCCMVSPTLVEQFVAPMTSYIGRHLGPVRFHACGSVTHLLEAFAKVEELHSLDLGGETSIRRAREIFGPAMPISIAPLPRDMSAESTEPILAWANRILEENAGGNLACVYHLEPGYNVETIRALTEFMSPHDVVGRKGETMNQGTIRTSRRHAAMLVLCAATLSICDGGLAAGQAVDATNRPMRARQNLVLTIGQAEGDLRGSDDKIIQAGVDYLHRLGGGTLRILPGVYELRNAIYLHPNITMTGSGEKTILRKSSSVVTRLSRDSDWFEYGVRVNDATGFVPGGGIMLRSKTGPGDWQFDVLRATITAIREDVILLDRLTTENFWTEKDATAATVFPLLTAEHVDNVEVEDLVLDGDRDNNEHINGNFAGAVFIQHCNRWRFRNVVARNYNGDGFSFQVCDDIGFHNCKALNNADLGFHPGSGSQRPTFDNCTAQGNSLGLFFCWSVSDGHVHGCTFTENGRFGISVGHRDTDNVIEDCVVERNGEVGILFREEGGEFRGGHRNLIDGCVIRDNGKEKPGIGIDIQGKTRDITIRNTRLENTAAGSQKTGIRIGREAQGIILQDNTFNGSRVPTEDLRSVEPRS